ncbi:MAG: S-layer homology domain-containing protein [Clostridiales bacterium]|nr:S-layer homology domain-containing protein [Clostridiales bacterium]
MKNLFFCRAAAGAAAFLIAAGIIAFGGLTSRADGEIEINETNFPDKAFRDYVEKKFDSDNNGKLDSGEIASAKDVWFSYEFENPADFKGIEYFTELERFYCSSNKLTSLDLSKNVNLDQVFVGPASLKSLNVSGCTKLTYLQCNDCGLSELDVTNNTELIELQICNNNFKTIDLSKNTKLEWLQCYYSSDNDPNKFSKITSLDLSNIVMLKYLECNNNDISELDLSSCKNLEHIDCSACNLEKLNVTGLDKLKTFEATGNKLTNIDLSTNTALTELDLQYNELTDAKFGESPDLERIFIYHNKLKSMDVSKVSGLQQLYVYNNQLESLDLSKNTKIRRVECNRNKIKDLNPGNSSSWKLLDCEDNNISSIVVPENINSLRIKGNNIDKLDISKSKNLINTYTDGELTLCKDDDGSTYYFYFTGNPDATTDDDVENNGYLTVDTGTKIIDGNDTSLYLDKTSATVVCGKTLTLKATLKGAKGKLTWSSSNKSIATVDKNGKVSGKMAGTVTITVSGAGRREKCSVQVLYKDVKNEKDFWYTPTYYLTDKDIVKGYDKQTKFKPANECTRAQMLTFIWRLKGEPEPSSDKCIFPDVKKSDYFFKPVIWAVEQGITTGYSDGSFKPQNVCTRAQTVTFLWRLAGSQDPASDENKFKDIKESDYFYKPVLWASEAGIAAGYKDGTFKPQGKCLRRQMVTFLYKYYMNVKKAY